MDIKSAMFGEQAREQRAYKRFGRRLLYQKLEVFCAHLIIPCAVAAVRLD